jgi:hypothetical protein
MEPLAPALWRVARPVQLAYAREHLPDLTIRHTLTADGPVSRATFTFRGRARSVSSTGEGCEDAIVTAIVTFLRRELGARVEREPAHRNDLERQIVRARYHGRDAEAEALTLELVRENAGRGRGWAPRVRIGDRPL